MEEKYYLPVLFTEEERIKYAEWGMKKEKVLVPYAIITIFIDLLVVIGTVIYMFWVRDKEAYFSSYLSAWGSYIVKFSYGIALLMTVMILKPIDLLLNFLFHKPSEPKMLCLTPMAQGIHYVLIQGKNTLFEGDLDWSEWTNVIAPETNEICIEGEVLRIGANTIETIYPEGKQKNWMDRPDETIKNSIKLEKISQNFKGYLASLEERKKEEAWLKQGDV